MKLQDGHLFTTKIVGVSCVCIPTNGSVSFSGNANMNTGLALEARSYLLGIEKCLGGLITKYGNKVQLLGKSDKLKVNLCSFPTREYWRDMPNLSIIERSCKELVILVQKHKWKHILLPQVGAEEGELNWKEQVEPLLSKLLDDRFTVIKSL